LSDRCLYDGHAAADDGDDQGASLIGFGMVSYRRQMDISHGAATALLQLLMAAPQIDRQNSVPRWEQEEEEGHDEEKEENKDEEESNHDDDNDFHNRDGDDGLCRPRQ
jgi:hypothetical protein